MPFSSTKSCSQEEWDDIFNEVFQPVVASCGYSCERASVSTGSLIKSIIERLRSAFIVLADITDNNPNVFYELGVRHSLSKRTIIIAQNAEYIPSDLRGYWSLVYGTKPGAVKKFKQELRRIISAIEADPDKSDSPVSDFMDREFVALSQQTQRENLKRLSALHTELSGNVIALEALRAGSKNERELLSTDCLSLLLSTMYIDLGPDIQKNVYELRNVLRIISQVDCSELSQYKKAKLLFKARIGLANLLEMVKDVRQKLGSGQLEEPNVVTVMEWKPEWTNQSYLSALSIGCYPDTDSSETISK